MSGAKVEVCAALVACKDIEEFAATWRRYQDEGQLGEFKIRDVFLVAPPDGEKGFAVSVLSGNAAPRAKSRFPFSIAGPYEKATIELTIGNDEVLGEVIDRAVCSCGQEVVGMTAARDRGDALIRARAHFANCRDCNESANERYIREHALEAPVLAEAPLSEWPGTFTKLEGPLTPYEKMFLAPKPEGLTKVCHKCGADIGTGYSWRNLCVVCAEAGLEEAGECAIL